jgi:uncharacterized membrane protein YbhN (UPF0104 family)
MAAQAGLARVASAVSACAAAVTAQRSALARTLISLAVVAAVVVLGVMNRSTLLSGLQSLARADGEWLTVAAVAAAAIWVAGTVTQLGSSPVRPPVARLFAVQVAGSFINQLLPAGVGGMAVNVRFLQRHGLSRGAAMASVGLNSLATAITHVLLLVAAVALAPSVLQVPSSLHLGQAAVRLTGLAAGLGRGWPLAAVGAAVVAAAGLLVVTRGRPGPLLRRLCTAAWGLLRRVGAEVRGLAAVLRDPVRAVQLWLGASANNLLHALILFALLRAIASPAPVMAVVVSYLAASALATVVPSPGGIGALDVTLVAGLVAVGAPAPSAVAAVLGYRLVTVWVPLVPGAVVFAELLRRRVI